MRTTTHIESALSGLLAEAYREQLAVVRRFVREMSSDDALPWLRRSMKQLFEQSLGLTRDLSDALARLATELPPPDSSIPMLTVVVERCALQRALVAAGLASAVRPYYLIAAKAAISGLSVPEKGIIVHDPRKRVARIPTLPPLHGQDRSLEHVGTSPYFKTKWED